MQVSSEGTVDLGELQDKAEEEGRRGSSQKSSRPMLEKVTRTLKDKGPRTCAVTSRPPSI